MRYTAQQQQHQLRLSLQLSPAELPTDPAAREAALQQFCAQILRENAWEPSREPRLEIVRETPQQLQVSCVVELFPSVTLPQHLNVELTAPAMLLPQEEDLLARVQALQLQYAEQTDVTRPADWGDLICVDWIGTCSDQLIPESVRSRFWLLLSQDPWASPLAAFLHGVQAGQQLSVSQPLAADFPYLPWRGKTAQYHVFVHAVQAVRVPPANDLLAQLNGLADFEALLSQLHKDLRAEKQAAWRQQLREQVVAEVLSQSRLQVPASWIKDTLEASWEATDKAALQALQPHLPQAAALLENGLKSWQQQRHLYQSHEQALATQLVLRAVARQQQLQLKEAEITAALDTLGQPLNLSADLVWGALQQDAQDHRLLNQLLLDKAADWLVRQASIYYESQLLQIP